MNYKTRFMLYGGFSIFVTFFHLHTSFRLDSIRHFTAHFATPNSTTMSLQTFSVHIPVCAPSIELTNSCLYAQLFANKRVHEE